MSDPARQRKPTRAQLAEQTFHDAIEAVRKQLIERGRGGVLVEVEVHLSEDGWTAMLYADYAIDDDPARAVFALPKHYADERAFPHEVYALRARDALHPEREEARAVGPDRVP